MVANPNIGYGAYTISYAGGASREFYRISLSANTSGISVYVLGLDDKTFLMRTYGASIGKATITGYCIKFRRLSAIDSDVLQSAIRHRMNDGRAEDYLLTSGGSSTDRSGRSGRIFRIYWRSRA